VNIKSIEFNSVLSLSLHRYIAVGVTLIIFEGGKIVLEYQAIDCWKIIYFSLYLLTWFYGLYPLATLYIAE